jgi:hypothetical protein
MSISEAKNYLEDADGQLASALGILCDVDLEMRRESVGALLDAVKEKLNEVRMSIHGADSFLEVDSSKGDLV